MIPRHLILDGLSWEVTLADCDAYGDTCGEETQIRIRRSLTKQLQEQTFWHELIHAFFETREVDADTLTQEQVARVIGPALFSFFAANVAEIKWKGHCHGEAEE